MKRHGRAHARCDEIDSWHVDDIAFPDDAELSELAHAVCLASTRADRGASSLDLSPSTSADISWPPEALASAHTLSSCAQPVAPAVGNDESFVPELQSIASKIEQACLAVSEGGFGKRAWLPSLSTYTWVIIWGAMLCFSSIEFYLVRQHANVSEMLTLGLAKLVLYTLIGISCLRDLSRVADEPQHREQIDQAAALGIDLTELTGVHQRLQGELGKLRAESQGLTRQIDLQRAELTKCQQALETSRNRLEQSQASIDVQCELEMEIEQQRAVLRELQACSDQLRKPSNCPHHA